MYRKIYLLLLLGMLGTGVQAQSSSDTVLLGPGYANQAWYSLAQGEVLQAPKNHWHLAFSTAGFGTAIHFNNTIAAAIWLNPVLGAAQYDQLDTTNLANWTRLYNSETDWQQGALNQPADTSNAFDLGWGTYSMVTHTVQGNRVFVLQLPDQSYRKLLIESLAGGAFNFKYAALNGSNEQSISLAKAPYATKRFVYFDLIENQIRDREPAANSWDLLFTQYTTALPQPYTVAGILQNDGVQAVRIDGVDTASFQAWQNQPLVAEINTIGFNWKRFTGMGWSLLDSTVYLVKDQQQQIWRITFPGFGGSANGGFYINKRLLGSTASTAHLSAKAAFLQVYPNPVTHGHLQLQTDFPSAETAVLLLRNQHGQLVYSRPMQLEVGLTQQALQLPQLPAGMYYLQLQSKSAATAIQKIILQ